MGRTSPPASTASIAVESGRHPRTVQRPSSAGWTPRTLCGLACSMVTICSSSGSAVAVDVLRRGLLTSRLLQDPLYGRQRDPYPFGSVGRLVGDFVDGLVELEGGQHPRSIGVGGGQHLLDTGAREVAVEEPGPVVGLPRRRQLADLAIRLVAVLPQPHLGGVV